MFREGTTCGGRRYAIVSDCTTEKIVFSITRSGPRYAESVANLVGKVEAVIMNAVRVTGVSVPIETATGSFIAFASDDPAEGDDVVLACYPHTPSDTSGITYDVRAPGTLLASSLFASDAARTLPFDHQPVSQERTYVGMLDSLRTVPDGEGFDEDRRVRIIADLFYSRCGGAVCDPGFAAGSYDLSTARVEVVSLCDLSAGFLGYQSPDELSRCSALFTTPSPRRCLRAS